MPTIRFSNIHSSANFDPTDFYGMDFADEVKRSEPKREVFSANVQRLAQTEYFYDWAATRLGIPRKMAKALTYLRLYNGDPLQVAVEIAKHSTILEVRSACETYINDSK
jgi:hypothetical protein